MAETKSAANGSMAEAAKDAVGKAGDGIQEPLVNMSSVNFVGMSWDTADVPDLGEEVTFEVTGIVTKHGDQLMKTDGLVRPFATVDVSSIRRLTGPSKAPTKKPTKAAAGKK